MRQQFLNRTEGGGVRGGDPRPSVAGRRWGGRAHVAAPDGILCPLPRPPSPSGGPPAGRAPRAPRRPRPMVLMLRPGKRRGIITSRAESPLRWHGRGRWAAAGAGREYAWVGVWCGLRAPRPMGWRAPHGLPNSGRWLGGLRLPVESRDLTCDVT